MNTCHSKYLNICLSVACCGAAVSVAEQAWCCHDRATNNPSYIFIKTARVLQFQEMANGFCCSRHKVTPAPIFPALHRGACVESRHQSPGPEERHLFLLVNANKVLLPNVGLCERGSADPEFLSSSENYSLAPVAQARVGHAAWSPLTVNLHV